MTAIHIRKKLDSETLHLPELRPLIGQTVEITVQNVDVGSNGLQPGCYDAFFALAGNDIVDPDAYGRLRAASII